jgi:hypothetical protein
MPDHTETNLTARTEVCSEKLLISLLSVIRQPVISLLLLLGWLVLFFLASALPHQLDRGLKSNSFTTSLYLSNTLLRKTEQNVPNPIGSGLPNSTTFVRSYLRVYCPMMVV